MACRHDMYDVSIMASTCREISGGGRGALANCEDPWVTMYDRVGSS
jgi:hypothetical protein